MIPHTTENTRASWRRRDQFARENRQKSTHVSQNSLTLILETAVRGMTLNLAVGPAKGLSLLSACPADAGFAPRKVENEGVEVGRQNDRTKM
ncbi:hypothetical protein [Cryobacterium sp. TMT1-66-1]|uniref:hypothetical protein n=1 Tax=Cryobacterium sp. TMT1-66-1 TaxID=1259242 RepID=UPI00141AE599|nr:hypothetical protein [Cryobacterium sp. TMT1-66-1]